eukprot:g569.t1
MFHCICVILFLTFAVSSKAQNAQCEASSLGHTCMAALSSEYNLHWTLTGNLLELAMEANTLGWVGFSVAGIQDRMAPADAVIGWVSTAGLTVRAYNITVRNVTPGDEDPNINLGRIGGSENSTSTTIRFSRIITEGRFPIDPQAITLINYAYGIPDSLRFHGSNRRGSTTIRFADRPPRKRYNSAYVDDDDN